MKYLNNKEIIIRDANGSEHIVYFIIIALLDDNLRLNGLLGFNENFSSDYFCRICRAVKSNTRSATSEDESLLRIPQNYCEDVAKLAHGVKEECIYSMKFLILIVR